MAWNTSTSYTAASAWGYTQANGVGLDLRTWGGNVDAGNYNLSNLGNVTQAAGKAIAAGDSVTVNGAQPFFGLKIGGVLRTAWYYDEAGGALQLGRYGDSGAFVANVLTVARATGVVTFAAEPVFPALPIYANNAAAVAGGLTAGKKYRTGGDPDTVCIVH